MGGKRAEAAAGGRHPKPALLIAAAMIEVRETLFAWSLHDYSGGSSLHRHGTGSSLSKWADFGRCGASHLAVSLLGASPEALLALPTRRETSFRKGPNRAQKAAREAGTRCSKRNQGVLAEKREARETTALLRQGVVQGKPRVRRVPARRDYGAGAKESQDWSERASGSRSVRAEAGRRGTPRQVEGYAIARPSIDLGQLTDARTEDGGGLPPSDHRDRAPTTAPSLTPGRDSGVAVRLFARSQSHEIGFRSGLGTRFRRAAAARPGSALHRGDRTGATWRRANGPACSPPPCAPSGSRPDSLGSPRRKGASPAACAFRGRRDRMISQSAGRPRYALWRSGGVWANPDRLRRRHLPIRGSRRCSPDPPGTGMVDAHRAAAAGINHPPARLIGAYHSPRRGKRRTFRLLSTCRAPVRSGLAEVVRLCRLECGCNRRHRRRGLLNAERGRERL